MFAVCDDGGPVAAIVQHRDSKDLGSEAQRVGLQLAQELEKAPAEVPLGDFLSKVLEVATERVAQGGRRSRRELAQARVLARGVLARRQLEQAEGGSLSSEEVAQRLGITRQAVDVRRQKGQLVAWRVADRWRFPRWQFGENGLPLRGLVECLDRAGLDHQWAAMVFFLSPAESLGGARPLDLLRAGRTEEALAYAERYHRHGV
jgi:hypothetical protein